MVPYNNSLTNTCVVEVGASYVGVGPVLSQRDQWKEAPPLHLLLQASDPGWDIGNPELLAVKLVLEEWCNWFEEAKLPFVISTAYVNI